MKRGIWGDRCCQDRQDPGLEELYGKYKEFMLSLGKNREHRLRLASFVRFCSWWRGLDTRTRKRCETRFRKGYKKVTAEVEREAERVAKRYRTVGRAS